MKNSTILKGSLAVLSGIALIVMFSCEKSAINTAQQPKQEKLLTIHCSPYRSVVGFNAVCADLNVVTNCMVQACKGTSVTITLTHLVLVNPATSSPFIFSSTQTVTASEQNDVMLAAKAWANANKPTGYFIDNITYTPDYIVGPTAAGIDISVRYRKCTGSTPLPD